MSIEGHVIPGCMFLLFGIWTIINSALSYVHVISGKQVFRRQPYFLFQYSTIVFPLESVVKCSLSVIGVVGEFLTALSDGHFVFWGNSQHMAMYGSFGIVGACELLHYKKFPIPPKTVYVANILSFGTESILFYFHLHGRSHLDVEVHQLLIVIVFATFLAFVCEMMFCQSPTYSFVRAFLYFFQGTWFIQLAFILYPINGHVYFKSMDHKNNILATVIFTIHAMIDFSIFLAIWLAITWRLGRPNSNYHPVSDAVSNESCASEKSPPEF